MRKVTAQHFAEEHARQDDIVGKLRLADTLCTRIDLPKWLAHYFQRVNAGFIPGHKHFPAVTPSLHHAFLLPPIQPPHKSLYTQCSGRDFPIALPESHFALDLVSSAAVPRRQAESRGSNSRTAPHPDQQTCAEADEARLLAPYPRSFLLRGPRHPDPASDRKE